MPNLIGSYQLSDTANELAAQMHGATINQIVDIFGVYNRAARRIQTDVNLQETRVVAEFGTIYQGVYDYPLFIDLKGNSVADFFPQANRTSIDDYGQQYNKDFDLQKQYSVKPDFTPRYNGALRTIRINAPNLAQGTQVSAADIVSGANGTWSASGGASAPINNSLFYTDGVNGSVQTNLAAGQFTGSLQNSTLTAVDLTNNFNNNATQFFMVYMPNAASITALELQMGSSTANYYHLTNITTTWQGTAFQNGWNLIAVPFPSMTTVGTPKITAINFLKVVFTYDGTAQNQVLINQFYSRIGTIFMMEYYSKYLFRDAITGVFQEKATDDTNYVNLDTDAYNLFLFAVGAEAVQQMQGLDALFFDSNNFESRYTDALAKYMAQYKNERTKPHSYYYSLPQTGYRRYISSSWGLPPA